MDVGPVSTGTTPLSQLRLEVHQEDHELRTLLFGGGETTSDGLIKGEANRLGMAAVLNRMVSERLDLVGEISALRARLQRAEEALRGIKDAPLPRKTDDPERIAELYAAVRLAAQVALPGSGKAQQ